MAAPTPHYDLAGSFIGGWNAMQGTINESDRNANEKALLKQNQGKIDYQQDQENLSDLAKYGVNMDTVKSADAHNYAVSAGVPESTLSPEGAQSATDLAALKQRMIAGQTAHTNLLGAEAGASSALGEERKAEAGYISGQKGGLAELKSNSSELKTLYNEQQRYGKDFKNQDRLNYLINRNRQITEPGWTPPAGDNQGAQNQGTQSGSLLDMLPGIGEARDLVSRFTGSQPAAAAPSGQKTYTYPSGKKVAWNGKDWIPIKP